MLQVHKYFFQGLLKRDAGGFALWGKTAAVGKQIALPLPLALPHYHFQE